MQQLLAAGAVTVDGEVVTRAAARVAEGARVGVAIPDPVTPEDGPAPQDLPLVVLHADAAVIVVAKPAGMAVHPAPGTPDGTLVNVLLHRFPDLPGIGGERRPGIVHRLDKDTTGVMVVARTEAALRALQGQFKARDGGEGLPGPGPRGAEAGRGGPGHRLRPPPPGPQALHRQGGRRAARTRAGR